MWDVWADADNEDLSIMSDQLLDEYFFNFTVAHPSKSFIGLGDSQKI